jgi:hypothetical protein
MSTEARELLSPHGACRGAKLAILPVPDKKAKQVPSFWGPGLCHHPITIWIRGKIADNRHGAHARSLG